MIGFRTRVRLKKKPRSDHRQSTPSSNRELRYGSSVVASSRRRPDRFHDCLIVVKRFTFSPIIIFAIIAVVVNLLFVTEPIRGDTNKFFHIATSCTGKSIFPLFKKVEGAVLTSEAETDVNCTITFQTDTVLQHFMLRFQQLKLGCGDHLYIYDGAHDYGRVNIADLSCRSNLANVEPIRTTGNYVTLRYMADKISKFGDGFQLIITAVKSQESECPFDARCKNLLCISHDLLCDGINHCGDNSDETSYSQCPESGDDRSFWSSLFSSSTSSTGPITSTPAYNNNNSSIQMSTFLIVAAIVFVFCLCCVIVLIVYVCGRESHYATYQNQLLHRFGPTGLVPLQASSSLVLTQHPIMASPYHNAIPMNTTTLSTDYTPQHMTRGYSTLPLHFRTSEQSPNHQQSSQQQQLQLNTALNATRTDLSKYASHDLNSQQPLKTSPTPYNLVFINPQPAITAHPIHPAQLQQQPSPAHHHSPSSGPKS